VLNTDPSGRCAAPGQGDDYCHTDGNQRNPRDLTDWLYREMKNNLDDPRLYAVWRENQLGNANSLVTVCTIFNPITSLAAAGFYALAARHFGALVGDHKPWDFKHQILTRLGPGITLCSNGGCKNDVNYSVPGNIHFGFVAKEAGYAGLAIKAGAAEAEITDPAHFYPPTDPRYHPYRGEFPYSVGPDGVDINLGDAPGDNRAAAFGIRLYEKYGRSLTLDAFRQELNSAFPGFDSDSPDPRPVKESDAQNWPYPVGYFNP
jgi:hypothetical protein